MKQHLQHFEDNVGAIYRYICKVAFRWRNILWQCQCCTCELVRVDTPGWSNMLAHRLHEYITSLARHWPNVLGQRKAALHTLHCVPNRERMANKMFFIQPILAGKLCPPPPTAECIYIYILL